jgi:hypothetical protein
MDGWKDLFHGMLLPPSMKKNLWPVDFKQRFAIGVGGDWRDSWTVLFRIEENKDFCCKVQKNGRINKFATSFNNCLCKWHPDSMS